MRRMLYEYRGIGITRIVPWLVEGIILPVVLFSIYLKVGGGLEFGSAAQFLFNLLLPMFSAWWNICILQQYVENEGNEMYFLYKKSKLGTILKYLCIYCIPVCILHGIAGFGCSLLWREVWGVLIACIFVNGAVYLFLMLVPSSIAAVLLSVAYPIYVIYFYNGGYRWFIYYYRQQMSREIVMQGLLPMLIASICIFIVGYEVNIRRKTYL